MMFQGSEEKLQSHPRPVTYPLYTHCMPTERALRSCFYPFCTHCAPISKAGGLFAILQTRTERERRTQKERLPILPLNTLTGGSIYGKSVSKKDGLLDLPQNGYGANGTRKRRLFAHRRKRHLNNIKIEEVIAAETKRLSEMFGKTFLDCEDLIKLTGLGRDNVRLLMRSRRFPVVKVGKRQVVSILNFVAWQMRESAGGDFNGR